MICIELAKQTFTSLFDAAVNTRDKKTVKCYTEAMAMLSDYIEFTQEILNVLPASKQGHPTISKEEWQIRINNITSNFEVLEVGKKEIVLRCKHCGSIVIRNKSSVSQIYLRKGQIHCKCCQTRSGKFKDTVDYTAETPKGALKNLSERIINIEEPGLPPIQIKIQDKPKKAA